MKLYIAGPMSNLPDFNYPAFFKAADDLRAAGHEPINPAREREGIEYQGATWLDYMRHSLRDIADADGIAVLPGWNDSRGARIEIGLAEALDLPVRAVEAWLSGVEA